MMPRPTRAWLGLALALTTVACGSTATSGRSARPNAPVKTCALISDGTTADGEPVEICEKMHATRPFLRPPADEMRASPATLYMAATDIHYTTWVDRTGTRYRNGTADTPALPTSLRAPSHRMLYMIYKVTGTVKPFTDESDPTITKSIEITGAKPAILIKGKAIDEHFLGPWEGSVSLRAPDDSCTISTPCWDSSTTVPLRVRFTAVSAMEDIGVAGQTEDPLLPDGDRHKIAGAIENLTAPVKASDGSCMPALVSNGDANPFRPSSRGDLVLFRYPGMHAPAADQIVLEYPADTEGMGGYSGMDGLRVLHPINFLLETDSDDWTEITIHNHGTPNGSEINLRPVRGGGGACTPSR